MAKRVCMSKLARRNQRNQEQVKINFEKLKKLVDTLPSVGGVEVTFDFLRAVYRLRCIWKTEEIWRTARTVLSRDHHDIHPKTRKKLTRLMIEIVAPQISSGMKWKYSRTLDYALIHDIEPNDLRIFVADLGGFNRVVRKFGELQTRRNRPKYTTAARIRFL